MTRIVAAALGALALVVVAGYGPTHAAPESRALVPDAHAVVKAMRVGIYEEPRPRSNAEAASTAYVGVLGIIAGCQAGPTRGITENGLTPIGSTVYAIKPVTMIKGRMPPGDGYLYLALDDRVGEEGCDVPGLRGARIATYASEFTEDHISTEMPMNDIQAGRPAVQPLFVVGHHMAVAVEASLEGTVGVLLPLTGDFIETSLENIAPSGTAYTLPSIELLR